MFGFFRDRRVRKLLAEPMPRHREVVLERNVGHYKLLTPDQQAAMRGITNVLAAEWTWEGCGGLNITDEMKLTVSAEASLMLLGVKDHDYFKRVTSIVLYPTTFRTPNPEDGYEDDDLSDDEKDGEAWYRGPMVLNWADVLNEAKTPDLGFNVVIHELAHQIDFLDGEANGTPPLGSKAAEQRWKTVMTLAFEKHRRELDTGAETFFSEQAGDDEGEFFADACEAFYCKPHELEEEAPDVFDVIHGYFNVDPRGWFQ